MLVVRIMLSRRAKESSLPGAERDRFPGRNHFTAVEQIAQTSVGSGAVESDPVWPFVQVDDCGA